MVGKTGGKAVVAMNLRLADCRTHDKICRQLVENGFAFPKTSRTTKVRHDGNARKNMMPRPSALQLHDRKPVEQGTHKAIYEVETCPALIVKVMLKNQPPATTLPKRLKRFVHRLFPSLCLRPLMREYAAYIKLKIRQLEMEDDPPVAEFHGPILTDMGLGLLFEKIQTKSGMLGPTLGALFQTGNLPRYIPLLNDFAQSLFAWEIRANDLNQGNIVLGTRNGREQFVLVDGLGDSHLIPIRTWLQWFNKRSLNKRLAKIASKTRLKWNAGDRCFLLKT